VNLLFIEWAKLLAACKLSRPWYFYLFCLNFVNQKIFIPSLRPEHFFTSNIASRFHAISDKPFSTSAPSGRIMLSFCWFQKVIVSIDLLRPQKFTIYDQPVLIRCGNVTFLRKPLSNFFFQTVIDFF